MDHESAPNGANTAPTSSQLRMPRAAILWAAGEGSRLRPLSEIIPKPLLPIDGIPCIEQLTRCLANIGVNHATVVIGHGGDHVRRFMTELAPQLEITVAFAEQPERLGPADATRHALAATPSLRDHSVVIAATDTLWNPADLRTLIERFATEQPLLAMGAREWPIEQLPHRSRLVMDTTGRIERVLEKPSTEQLADLVRAGVEHAYSGSPVYVVQPRFCDLIDAATHGQNEFASAIQAGIDAGETVLGVPVGPTRDLTRPIDLLRENFPYIRGLLE